MSAHLPTEQKRYLSLTGVWIERSHLVGTVRPEMEALKRAHFAYDRDEQLILHRSDIVRCSGKFFVLRDEERRREFDADLIDCLKRWEFGVVTVVLDKQSHYDKNYRTLRHAYHYCVHTLVERFRGSKGRSGIHQGDVMAESREKRDDMELKRAFSALYRTGGQWLKARFVRLQRN